MTSELMVVVGMGETGLSCVRYLHAKNIPCGVIDTRKKPPKLMDFIERYPDVPVSFGKLECSLLNQATKLILSPGLSLQENAIVNQINRGISVVGDIELFAEEANAPVIAITGTNAKSTVTTLVGLMGIHSSKKTKMGGNLGTPALDLLQGEQADLYVLELSSFQLETTYSLKPKVGCILNISPDHMDRYATLSDYEAAKKRIYNHCENIVFNRDDVHTRYTGDSVVNEFAFTLQTPTKNEFGLLQKNGEHYLAFEDKPLLAVRDLPVRGKHYQANALAALAIGYAAELDFDSMIDTLLQFKGLPHRCQLVRKRNEVDWYNDSKGTNVGATIAAIQGLGPETKGKIILIAGGVGKNADFSSLKPVVKQFVKKVILIGEAADELNSVLMTDTEIEHAFDLADAINKADRSAKTNDIVLLSPACASFDMFKNFEHRGEVFTSLVMELP